MKFKLGEKYVMENVNLLIEVKGVFPLGQRTRGSFSDGDEYRILLNGHQIAMSESCLNYFIEIYKANEAKAQVLAEATVEGEKETEKNV